MNFYVVLWETKEDLLSENPAHEFVIVEANDSVEALHKVKADLERKCYMRVYCEEDYFEQFPRV